MTAANIKRIAILTGGGDAPGLNAVIRAAVKTAASLGWEVIGVEDGYEGLLGACKLRDLRPEMVRGLLPRGGTILGTTNRGSFGGSSSNLDGACDQAVANLRERNIDALVTIGGDGTQTIACNFHHRGFPVVGVPKTIDNDLESTDLTFGFDTALNVATDAIDRLHTTAESHDRVMVLEVMGRTAGWIALHAGIAGGADVILIPEIPFRIERVIDAINRREASGHQFSIIVVAEGAAPAGGSAQLLEASVVGAAARFGGIGYEVGAAVRDRTGKDTRVVVLGHLQRGGQPTAFDRLLGTSLGSEAIQALAAGKSGCLVAVKGTELRTVPLDEVGGKVKNVPIDSYLVRTARSVGIEFGAD